MKNIIKVLCTAILFISVIFCFASCNITSGLFPNVNSGNADNSTGLTIVDGEVFEYNEDGERIVYSNQFVEYQGDTYYAIDNKVVVGDRVIDGKAYRFNASGADTKEYFNEVFFESTGDVYYVINNYIVYGMQVVSDHIYNFGSDGIMLRSESDGDYGYDADGRLTGKAFVTIGDNTYYNADYGIARNITVIDGAVYNFGDNGAMLFGQQGDYWFDEDGRLVANDIFVVDSFGKTFYIVNNLVVYNLTIINGAIYNFGYDGDMITGAYGDYVFGEDGRLVGDNVFVTVRGDTYLIVNNYIVYNMYVLDGYVYDFGDDGKMNFGQNGNYLYDEDGRLVGNEIFITVNGDVYYIVNNVTVFNMVIIDGYIYDFGDDGKMNVGQNGDYYYDENGHLSADEMFITVNGDVYFVVNNVIVYNMYFFNGNIYDFGDDGKMNVGQCGDYFYDEDGRLVGNEIFVTVNGDVYYIINNVAVFNMIVIDGYIYDFGGDGKMKVGEYGGYYYDEDGRLVGNSIFVVVNGDIYFVINNVTVYNMYVIDGYIYDFGDDGKMNHGQIGDYFYGDDGRLVGDRIFVTVNGNVYYIVNNIAIYNLGAEGENGDADNDGISNIDEIKLGTNPTNPDTDGDGASDGKELAMGFDPMIYNNSFGVSTPPVIDSGSTPDTVTPTIDIELSGAQVDSLIIERDEFFSKDTLGYLGDAYRYEVDGDFDSATIGFEFDTTMLGAGALPTIYSYDTVKGVMTPLDTTIDGNKATAEVSSFATFVLLDRSIYEKELTWVDIWGLDNEAFTSIEIVFVIDDSGSMGPIGANNDPKNLRLSVSRELIAQLPEGSKIGIVQFADNTTMLTKSLISDKDTAMNYLTTSYFKSKGGTYMYEAMISAADLYSTPVEGDGVMRIMVVLSDGIPNTDVNMNTAVNKAIEAGVSIYTVGLGTYSFTAFDTCLKPLSEKTNGKFYLSSNASGLSSIFDDIGEKIDLTTDTDGDGLLDYYEDNMVIFNGLSYTADKTKADTDGDGLTDGREIVTIIIISADGDKMSVIGKVYSDPSNPDSDGDGVGDLEDASPLDPEVA